MPNSIQRHRHQAFLAQSCRCCYCGAPMWETQPDTFAKQYRLSPADAAQLQCTAEHLQARQNGGTNARSNIAAACLRCNRARHQTKNPLPADRYRSKVQARVAKGKWHQRHVLKALHLG